MCLTAFGPAAAELHRKYANRRTPAIDSLPGRQLPMSRTYVHSASNLAATTYLAGSTDTRPESALLTGKLSRTSVGVALATRGLLSWRAEDLLCYAHRQSFEKDYSVATSTANDCRCHPCTGCGWMPEPRGLVPAYVFASALRRSHGSRSSKIFPGRPSKTRPIKRSTNSFWCWGNS